MIQSLKQYGFYRNVVTARDGTILAGHGIIEAAKKLGLKQVPILRLQVEADDIGAIKLLIGDNEIEHLADQNDRLLTELLKKIKDQDAAGLSGTGYDEMMLANFVMVTRPESEIKDLNAAAAWVGMPEYDEGGDKIQLVITFPDEAKREAFVAQAALQLTVQERGKKTWSARWPFDGRDDKASIRWKEKEPAE